MAFRARLTAPPPPPKQEWPWHTAKCGTVSVLTLVHGERRLEAETYLSEGFRIRIAIEKQSAWSRFGEIARVWMPGRLKGIQVSKEFGTPFLSATQVYDVRPIPRKWLALARTSDASNRFVRQGTILVTCSGSVGRPTISYAAHDETLISHDLLRVEPNNHLDAGWLYAYLRSVHARAMAIGAHYGHIIKHLEPEHLDELPVPIVDRVTAKRFLDSLNRVISLRNESYRLTLEAEKLFADSFSPFDPKDWGESGFRIKAMAAFGAGRRRLDAANHNPGAAAIRAHLARNGTGFIGVADAGYDVWVPGRYKRIPAPDGVVYRDSADLLEVSPDLPKRFADCGFGDEHGGRVQSGWILIPSSGQVYGIIGTATLATDALHGQVVSNHVIRVAPRTDAAVRTGYLVTALSHLTLGRPLVKSLAFGSSVPEIAPEDLAALEVVRLRPSAEDAIADVAEAAALAHAEADKIEEQMGRDASAIIQKYMAGERCKSPSMDTQQLARHILDAVAPDA
jgi:hypothetical protein